MKFPLRVVSVERSLFEGDVEFIIATGAEGELGVLARHAPLMTILKPGPLRIQETYGGPAETLVVGGGLLAARPARGIGTAHEGGAPGGASGAHRGGARP